MMRQYVRGAGLAGLMLAIVVSVAHAQSKNDAIIEYKDRVTKKTTQVRGRIESETPGGINLKVREGKKEVVKRIAPDDIVYIQYHTEDKIAYRRGFIKETNAAKLTGKKQITELGLAVTEFLAAERDLGGHPEARRYLQYKAAMTGVALAALDPSRMAESVKRLQDFTAEQRGSWEILPALKTLARLMEDNDKPEEARKAYEQIASLSDIPKELARQSEVLVAKLYQREGKYAEAQKKLEALAAKLSPGDADKPYIEAYLAECKIAQGKIVGVEKALEASARGTTDPQLLAVLHNAMGECALKKGALEDAFWHFLRVDAMYNENAEEQARALYRLAPLFDKVKKDPARGKECLIRLAGKSLENTRFARQAKAEKKTGE